MKIKIIYKFFKKKKKYLFEKLKYKIMEIFFPLNITNKIPINLNNVINDYKKDSTIQYFSNFILQNQPLFFARIGGSDYEVVRDFYLNKSLFSDSLWLNKSLDKVSNLNGYFDFRKSSYSFLKYLNTLTNSYKDSDAASFGGSDLIEEISTGVSSKFIVDTMTNKTLLHYSFFESVEPFLKSFKVWGEGKKILIISPLSKSLLYQKKNLSKIHKNYQFPDFELLVYNSPITYNNFEDNNDTLNINSKNWNEACHNMSIDISKIDFDIALLSCGSYSMYLGSFIKNNLGKKAIYIGGGLNVYFGIYGGRYDTHFFNNFLNLEFQIEPFENNDILSISGGRQFKSESLNAYFGNK